MKAKLSQFFRAGLSAPAYGAANMRGERNIWVERIDTLVVGGGQAGIAMSEHLSAQGITHLVLEQGRIAERWRSRRWDSLVMNGPAWHDRFPGLTFDSDPDGFPGKEDVAAYFEHYVAQIDAPLRTGVTVTRAAPIAGKSGYLVETSAGPMHATRIVAATGAFQKPVIPPVIPADAPVTQLHSADYRNPAQLPTGAVLVVGGGSSGTQIADELNQAGRTVFLSLGPHDRPPRAYRARDYCWWLGVLGKWDLPTPGPGTEHVTIAVSGAGGGRTVDFRRFAEEGITLLGMTEGYENGTLSIAADLQANLDAGDANYLGLLREADAYIAANGLDLPLEEDAHDIPADPDCVTTPIRTLNLAEAGISTVLWATGYTSDYAWLEADTFDERGNPLHSRGVSRAQGVYFLGLPWLSRRGSSFIWGVWHDAKFIADQIAIQHSYGAYAPHG